MEAVFVDPHRCWFGSANIGVTVEQRPCGKVLVFIEFHEQSTRDCLSNFSPHGIESLVDHNDKSLAVGIAVAATLAEAVLQSKAIDLSLDSVILQSKEPHVTRTSDDSNSGFFR